MPNRLASEASPYLRQHAENPVHWMPWGEEALDLAVREQKPIFLSIGYSTCHWCHVMAHESFEDPEIAELLNRSFVPIKIDREERPDIDRVYMTYIQATTGYGGWPLSVWLTPDLKPFFGGTYFPPENRGGRAGFPTVLEALAKAWATDRERVVGESEKTVAHLGRYLENQYGNALPDRWLEEIPAAIAGGYNHLRENFDPDHGGFGGAPKFPRASNLDLLCVVARSHTADADGARRMLDATLTKMAQGGIRDHVGGGFHRYSVDEEWFVPHFEKMLYDQAQIAMNYLDGHRLCGREIHAWVAREILEYVLRDLSAPEGGFYSAEDADSAVPGGEGHAEGAFYLWKKAEVEQVAGDAAPLLCAVFDVRPGGNVGPESDPHGDFAGKNLLRQVLPLANAARMAGLSVEEADQRLFGALERLREARGRRPRPPRDEKIIAAWNGLAVSALVKAARLSSGKHYVAAAKKTAEFVWRNMFDQERGRLLRSYCQGARGAGGFAEDHAFWIQGLIDLYEATFEVRWLQWALELQGTMDALFLDNERGGYYNTASGERSVILRLKEDYDGAEPSASSIAALNLLRLAPVSGDEEGWRKRATDTIKAFAGRVNSAPQALPKLMCAMARLKEEPSQVVLTGDPNHPEFFAMKDVAGAYGGTLEIYSSADADGWAWLSHRAPWIGALRSRAAGPTAYVCRHYTCKLPATTAAELRERLLES